MDKKYLAEAANGSNLIIQSAIDLSPGQVYLSKAAVPLEYPPSPNGTHDYIIQAHFRGKSLADWTPIIIKKDGLISVIPIGSLWPPDLKGPGQKIYEKPGSIQVWTPCGWEPMVAVMRHAISKKKLLRIRTYGASIDITEDHSLFNDPKVSDSVIRGDEIREGHLLKLYPGLPNLYPGRNSVSCDYAWLVGLWLAEGHFHKGETTEITSSDLRLLEKAEAIAFQLGFPTHIAQDESSYKLGIGGWRIFRQFVWQGPHLKTDRRARYKILPQFLFRWHLEARKSFFEGYLEGDGDHNSNNPWRFSTSSQCVAEGLRLLCADMFPDKAFSVALQARLFRCGFIKANHSLRKAPGEVRAIIRSQPRPSYGKDNPNYRTGKYIFSPEARNQDPRFYYSGKRYVYDLETPSHQFVAGIGGLVAHNSVHLDLRIERDAKWAEGWTLLAQQKGVLPEPVTTLAEARKWTRSPRLWKFDLKTGKILPRRIETTIGGRKRTIVRPGSLQATRKVGLVPKGWMKVQGVIPAGKDVPGEPVPAGATAQFPGVFVIIDRGKLTFGARKAHFFEYFIEQGRLLSDRIVFRRVSRAQVSKDLAWEQFRSGELYYEPEIGILKQVLPPGERPEAPTEKTFWLFMTLDTEPYVLGLDAIRKGWLPPKGVAALPQGFQSKAPAASRYWKMTDGAKRSEARRELKDFFKEKPVAKEEDTGFLGMPQSEALVGKMDFIAKSAKKQIVYGIVLFPEEYGKDKQHDKVPQEEIELAAYRYLAFGRQIGFFHRGTPVPAFPVESGVARTDFLLDENAPKSAVKKGEWYLGVWLPRKEDWARVESGEVKGFSLEGKAQRERV